MALIIFIYLHYTLFLTGTIVVSFMVPVVWFTNRWKGYLWGLYTFFITGFVFYFYMNLKMGRDSFMILYYFPFIIGMLQLMGRRELIKHLTIVMISCFLSIVAIVIGFKTGFLYEPYDLQMQVNVKYINIVLVFFLTLSFIFVVVKESVQQEILIQEAVHEKDILLAEVFHRVKNNLNVVTSLLNLKKEETNSTEAKEALEECKNRVYSMALVHQNIYKGKKFTDMDLNEYLHDLIDELLLSNDLLGNAEVSLKCDDISLDLSTSVPVGLILNELVTNSFKYAAQPDQKLRLSVEAKREGEKVIIHYRDNGPGLINSTQQSKKTLGLEIIDSLVLQLNGNFKSKNENGFEFEFEFRLA